MFYLSNVQVFYSIAEEAHEAMRRSMDESRTPKPDGTGYIIKSDQGFSFKQACITIAFAGMFLEAAAYFVSLTGKSKSQAEKVDAVRSYRQKLEEIGITDLVILEGAEQLQRARRELVHEKAMLLGGNLVKMPLGAQDAAIAAFGVILSLREQLSAP